MILIEIERRTETLPQAFHEIERAAQKQDIAFDAVSLRQRSDGLVDHGLEDACAQIRFIRALIDQRLDIRLGEHAAARRDRIQPVMLQAETIHRLQIDVEQRGHLIDEGSSAAGTGRVHALFHGALEKQDLSVFTAQLDRGVDFWIMLAHCLGAGKYFLDERQAAFLAHAQGGTAAQREIEWLTAKHILELFQLLERHLADLRHVALIALI